MLDAIYHLLLGCEIRRRFLTLDPHVRLWSTRRYQILSAMQEPNFCILIVRGGATLKSYKPPDLGRRFVDITQPVESWVRHRHSRFGWIDGTVWKILTVTWPCNISFYFPWKSILLCTYFGWDRAVCKSVEKGWLSNIWQTHYSLFLQIKISQRSQVIPCLIFLVINMARCGDPMSSPKHQHPEQGRRVTCHFQIIWRPS